MLGKTHLLGGLAAGCLVAGFVADPIEQAFVIGIASAAGLLPDIDHAGSTAGRKFPILSILMHWTVGHRTLTHSLGAVAFVTMASLLLLPISWAAALVLGYVSHLLLDYISYARYETASGRMVKSQGGIPVFWPNKKRYSKRIVEIGSLTELILVRFALVGMCVFSFAASLMISRLFA